MKTVSTVVIAIGLLALVSGVVLAQNGNDLFQQALVKERTEGNFAEAIKLYQTVVQKYSSDRKLAARALFQIGQAYEKLGKAEARKTYERIAREFADQKDVVAMSRARLEVMPSSIPGAVQAARRIWSNAGIAVTPPSADGRYLAFSDQAFNVAVRDLKDGTTHRLTDAARMGERGADYVAISPDGRQVAYGWAAKTGYELRILPATARESTKPRTLHRETPYVQPWAWTPDAKALLVIRQLKDRTWQIASVSISDESVHVLKSLGSDSPFRISVSSDGRYFAYDIPTAANSGARDIFVSNMDGSRETVVAQNPANDNEPMWSPDGSELIFKSNRSGKMALWSVPMDGGTPRGPAELLNAEIPSSFYAVGMTRDGALYYGQNVGSANVYAADLDDKLNVKGMPVRVTDRGINSNSGPGWSPDGDHLAYLSARGDSRDLIIQSLKTGEEREISLPPIQGRRLNGFPVRWFPDGRSVLLTALDGQNPRIAYYRLDLASGKPERVHNSSTVETAGYPSLSPNGKTIFYADLDPDGPVSSRKLVRYDIDTRRETVLKRWPGGRFVTSVAISANGEQLAYILSDSPARSASLEVMPTSGGESREVHRIDNWLDQSRHAGLAWSPDQRYLIFVQPEKAEPNPRKTLLWRVPVSGGAPQNMGVAIDVLRFPEISPDGRKLTFESSNPESRELWALENFLPRR